MKKLNVISAIIMWIGGINYLLIGAINLNLIALVFGEEPVLVRIAFILFGLATVYQIFHCRACKKCTR
jgi:uncharacterized membrane protein YuzA (DUF378 family)